jgi:hypothetical protein
MRFSEIRGRKEYLMKSTVKHVVVLVTLTFILAPAASVLAQTYPEGMVSYWKFDESSGSTAIDSVNGNHGTIDGANRTTGVVDGALSFDGVNDFVRISHSSNINLATTDFTLEAWIKTSDLAGNIFFHYYSGGYYLVVNEGKLLGAIRSIMGYPKLFSNILVNDDHWHHVVFIRHYNEKAELYIDGSFENSLLETVGNISRNVPLDLGRDTWHSTVFLNGIIDEAAIYSRALIAEEIQQHYQNGLNGRGYELPPALSCSGFEPPMDGGPITARGNRALPLKAQLIDDGGLPISDIDVTALPIVQVVFSSGSGGDPIDVSDHAYPAGWGTDGNQFEYNLADLVWQFNLKTKNYTGPGTYSITMVSGDDSEYIIDPACEAVFVRE